MHKIQQMRIIMSFYVWFIMITFKMSFFKGVSVKFQYKDIEYIDIFMKTLSAVLILCYFKGQADSNWKLQINTPLIPPFQV